MATASWRKATSLCGAVHLGPPILREWGSLGVTDGIIQKVGGGFLYRLSIVTNAQSLTTIRPQFAVDVSDAQNNQQVSVQFGVKFWKEGVDRCKPDLKAIWKRHGAVAKDIVSKLSAVWVQCKNVTDKQTQRQTAER